MHVTVIHRVVYPSPPPPRYVLEEGGQMCGNFEAGVVVGAPLARGQLPPVYNADLGHTASSVRNLTFFSHPSSIKTSIDSWN